MYPERDAVVLQDSRQARSLLNSNRNLWNARLLYRLPDYSRLQGMPEDVIVCPAKMSSIKTGQPRNHGVRPTVLASIGKSKQSSRALVLTPCSHR